jgi:hypothetical protein
MTVTVGDIESAGSPPPTGRLLMARPSLAPAILLAAVPAAAGQVAIIPPFTGPHTEGFETQALQRDVLYECLPGRIFAGTADLCDHQTRAIIVPTFWSLFCIAFPHQGERYVLGLESPVEIAFDSPAARFGGYFATVGGVDGGTVEFRSAGGVLVGTATLTTDDCAWLWNGWESAAPFSRVRIIGNSPFSDGGYIHMDDLEYSPAAPACYPNCDGSTAPPILNVLDFSCFLNAFAASSPYANCDASTSPPMLNVLDFTCFLNRFAAGCR